MILMLVVALFAFLAKKVESGRVIPVGSPAVVLSTNNCNRVSNYNFTFSLETSFINGDLLLITFPSEFLPGLVPSGQACQAFYYTSVTRTLACSITNRQVLIQNVSINPALKVHTVGILKIYNPNILGGVNPFQVTTMRGPYIIDHNEYFEVIGLAPEPRNTVLLMIL
jgi:hypothetical protein